MVTLLPSSLIFPGVRIAADKQFTGFLEGLGPAQLAGRQTLATPPMGKLLPSRCFVLAGPLVVAVSYLCVDHRFKCLKDTLR